MLNGLLVFYLNWIKRLNTPSRIIGFACQKYKNQTFLIHPQTNTTLTFSQWKERVGRLSLYLNEIGLHGGDVLAFSASNCLEYFEIRAASHLSGIIFLGLPAHISREDTAYFLNKTKAKAFFYRRTEGSLNIAVPSFDLDSPAYKQIFQKLSSNQRQNIPCHCEAVRRRRTTEAISTLNLSSATTQKTPKIIRLSSKNWTESAFNYIRNSEAGSKKQIVFLCAVPFLTAGSTGFLPSMLAGITHVVIKEDFTPQDLTDYIQKYKVNRLYITPSRLLELLEYCKAGNKHLSSLDSIITGTERMPAKRLREAIDFFGPIVTVGYGMVEALPPIAMLSPKDYRVSSLPGALDSVGKAAKGVKVKIADDARIAVKSKTVSQGYLDNPDENAKCFKDGWFYTNDYGCIDNEGFLHILGRKEEILTQTPRPVFAKEVEDKIYELPFIKRCAAITKNGRVLVFASLRDKMEEEEAQKKILESVKSGNLMELLPATDIIIKETLPINAAGKLDRRKMSETPHLNPLPAGDRRQ